MKVRSLESLVAPHRPPGAPAREAAALGEIAGLWRSELAGTLAEARVETLALKGFCFRPRFPNISLLGAA